MCITDSLREGSGREWGRSKEKRVGEGREDRRKEVRGKKGERGDERGKERGWEWRRGPSQLKFMATPLRPIARIGILNVQYSSIREIGAF